MKQVKAKFFVSQVNNFVGGRQVHMHPVHNSTAENTDFAKYAPAGKLELNINEGTLAYDFFVPGKEVYLLFSEIQISVKEDEPIDSGSQSQSTAEENLGSQDSSGVGEE